MNRMLFPDPEPGGAPLLNSRGTLSGLGVSISPQVGCLALRGFSKESEHFLV